MTKDDDYDPGSGFTGSSKPLPPKNRRETRHDRIGVALIFAGAASMPLAAALDAVRSYLFAVAGVLALILMTVGLAFVIRAGNSAERRAKLKAEVRQRFSRD